MAEGGANPSLGGYDDEFVNAVDEELQCAICYLPLKDPFLTRCGHRFCETCLDEHFESQIRTQEELAGELSYESWHLPIQLSCPSDRNELVRDKDIFPDKATERKILSFHIKCPSEGCEWTGELRNKENHLSSCPLKVVSCTNQECPVTLTRNRLQEHLTIKCEWRILSCTHCSMSYPACKTEDHERQCKRKPVLCTNDCYAMLPREEIPAHKENDCPLAIVSCPYAQMGCTEKVQRREVESHLQCATRVHFDLAFVKLSYTQEELKKSQEVIRKLDDKVNTLENKLKLFEAKANTEDLKRTMLEEKFHTLEGGTKRMEEKVTKLDKEQVNREEFEEHEARLNAPKNTWKINNFSEVLGKAEAGEETEISSAPFYDNGYKFALKLKSNGHNDRENTHLSIFFIIMKSDYDAMLPWPFNKKVTFTVIDQQQQEKYKKNIIKSLQTNPKLKSFQRPKADSNTGYGFHTFVSLTDLRTRCYVVDDVILIQVKIDPPR